jgi:hypothetical protein
VVGGKGSAILLGRGITGAEVEVGGGWRKSGVLLRQGLNLEGGTVPGEDCRQGLHCPRGRMS